MSITEETFLPTEEDLTVQEINVSGPVLRAGAAHLGLQCQFENNEFMLCREELGDPRKCIEEGKAVTSCALLFFQKVKRHCNDEFARYVKCIDQSSSTQAFTPCRKTQGVFDKCMLDNLNMERGPFDHYCRVQVHKAIRPKPPAEGLTIYPDATPYLPDDVEKPPAKYGARIHWMW